MIRHACDEILDAREGRTVRMTLGEPTLEQLAERLSQEFKAALVESVDPTARSLRVPLGEGTEVLGALWGAIARVQEIVSRRTKGAIRFGGDAPEGAIALAPWLHQELPGADRMAGRGRGAAADVRLNGRRVVVADDDPGVTWFISDLLRTAGCDVHEALDGTTALDLAFRVQPELVVSDILMPGLDGFALCRALRRDVALRDTPVMLLSWKEDLLQRVRELGASAAAYMRKESDSRAVLARVREVLRPRARIEMRLRGDGEVRGRLDDLSPRLLLELVCIIRKDARVAVRDATFLYEIEIRGGAPRKATRTASDGSFQSGERALAMLLAVGAGRFAVASSTESIRGELTGTLFELLARPLAAARGALAATTGARTMEVERISLDPSVLEEYLRATPDPARTVLKRLAGGTSPRAMLLAGEAAPSLVEDLLSDLAARCAIRAVEAADGTDLLTPAIEAALAVMTGSMPARRTMPPNARPSMAPRPPAVLPPAETAAAAPPAMVAPEALLWSAPPPAPPPSKAASSRTPMRSPVPPMITGGGPSSSPRIVDDDDAPSSLEDAVMREISERSPDPGAVHGGLDLPPIVEPSELRPRSSNPPANQEEAKELVDDHALLPSIPPDAIVPAATSNEEFAVASPVFGDLSPPPDEVIQLTSERRLVVRDPSPVPAPREEARAPQLTRTLREAGASQEAATPARDEAGTARRDSTARQEIPARPEITERLGSTARPESSARLESGARQEIPARQEITARLGSIAREEADEARPEASAPPQEVKVIQSPLAIVSLPPDDLHEVPDEPKPPTPAASPPASTSSSFGFFLAFALLAGAVVGVLRMGGRESDAPRGGAGAATTASAATTITTAPSASAPVATAAAAPTATAPTATARAAATADDDLPPGSAIPFGYGLLQIGAPANARVFVDGADAGGGPLSSSAQRAGYHQVRIDQDGKHTQYVIEVRAGKVSRVKSSPLP